jgi:CDP-6-deoxy-D-xylo-4-hexulose-3-dehydrase
MGEGGAICTNDEQLHVTMRGFRNWGRYCASPNCCVRSVDKMAMCPGSKLTNDSELPKDYIVNYQYEWMGYNLKPLELQAAILSEQIKKLDEFNDIRRRNYDILYQYFKVSQPNIKIWSIDEDVSPFAFPILIPKDSKFTRKNLMDFLNKNKVETRLLFGGNLTKHPAYSKISDKYEIFGEQTNSDLIMDQFIMLGVSPINDEVKMHKMVSILDDFFKFWRAV